MFVQELVSNAVYVTGVVDRNSKTGLARQRREV
jgi:hypothetical protein